MITLDLDGVVARQTEGLYNRIVEFNPTAKHYSDWDSYHIEEMFPELDGWVGEQFSDPSFYIGLNPFVDSVDWIKHHIKKNQICIVTARPYNVRKATWAWFRKFKIPITQIYDVKREDKPDLLHILEPDFMVEDDPRNARNIAETGHVCYLVNRPYNLDFDAGNAVRIDSLDEVEV